MRLIIVAAACTAAFGLTACQQSTSSASEAPVAKKDLGRSQVFYQGQEMVQKVDAATVTPGSTPGSLTLHATGDVSGAGYTDATFLRRIYPGPPPDGIYEVDVVATKPAGSMVPQSTPIDVSGSWSAYPATHLKGVRFMAKGNAITVPLAPAK